jgi:hypothetical protein
MSHNTLRTDGAQPKDPSAQVSADLPSEIDVPELKRFAISFPRKRPVAGYSRPELSDRIVELGHRCSGSDPATVALQLR